MIGDRGNFIEYTSKNEKKWKSATYPDQGGARPGYIEAMNRHRKWRNDPKRISVALVVSRDDQTSTLEGPFIVRPSDLHFVLNGTQPMPPASEASQVLNMFLSVRQDAVSATAKYASPANSEFTFSPPPRYPHREKDDEDDDDYDHVCGGLLQECVRKSMRFEGSGFPFGDASLAPK